MQWNVHAIHSTHSVPSDLSWIVTAGPAVNHHLNYHIRCEGV